MKREERSLRIKLRYEDDENKRIKLQEQIDAL
jgi:hypothetical protein